MISPSDTRITYFGGSGNPAVTEAIVKLQKAGFDVVAGSWHRIEAGLLREVGIPTVSDRMAALDDSQVVITSFRTPAEVENLYLGDNGLLELMEPGMYAVDLSFSTPQLAREIAAMAAISDIEVLDAPVVNLGEKEQACVFVGGNKDAIEDLSALFPYLAPAVYPQSGVGEGQFAAMIAYISLAGSMMGAIEAMSIAHIAGFNDSKAISTLASTSGGSRALIDYVPRMLAHDYSGNINVSEFLDALDVALDTAEQLGITLPLMETAYQLYDLLSVVGGDEMNIQAIALLYEDEQTCANYGLDWALADGLNGPDGYDGYDGYYGDEGGYDDGRPGGGGGIPPIDGFFSNN